MIRGDLPGHVDRRAALPRRGGRRGKLRAFVAVLCEGGVDVIAPCARRAVVAGLKKKTRSKLTFGDVCTPGGAPREPTRVCHRRRPRGPPGVETVDVELAGGVDVDGPVARVVERGGLAEAAKINLGATVRMVATRAADRAALRVPIAALRDVAGVPRGIGAIAGVGRRPLVFRERPVDGVPRDGLDHRPMTTSAGREETEDTDHHHAVVFPSREERGVN